MSAFESRNEAEWSSGGLVSLIDANALADLIGGTIALTDSLEVKRAGLLRGLSDLLGADAWAVISSPEGCCVLGSRIPEDHRIEMKSPLPGERPLPNLSTHPADALLWSSKPLQNRETGFICLVRQENLRPFSAREACLFRILVEEVPWLYGPMVEVPPTFHIPKMPPRRRIIFDLLRQGLDRKVIADHLEISVHTVGDHQKILYRELGINSQVTLMQHYRSSTPAPNEDTGITDGRRP